MGNSGFYRRFIKDFNKIALPHSKLLQKDIEFAFFVECKEAFENLKDKLISLPILTSPDWDFPFELSCDVYNYVMGAMLGQKEDNLSRVLAIHKKHSMLFKLITLLLRKNYLQL